MRMVGKIYMCVQLIVVNSFQKHAIRPSERLRHQVKTRHVHITLQNCTLARHHTQRPLNTIVATRTTDEKHQYILTTHIKHPTGSTNITLTGIQMIKQTETIHAIKCKCKMKKKTTLQAIAKKST